MILQSKHCGLFEVVEDVAWNNVIVRFVDTGYTTRVRRCRLKDGSIWDPLCPSVFGVGFVGVGEWDKKTHKVEFSKWFNMLNRCYNPKYLKNKPTYVGCSVIPRWHNFQLFCEDLKNLPGYELFMSGEICHLDKDLLVPGNKQYGPETCQFLLPEKNKRGLGYKSLNRN